MLVCVCIYIYIYIYIYISVYIYIYIYMYMYIYIYIYIYNTHRLISIMVSIHQRSKRPGFNPRSSHTKDSNKCYLMSPCLTLLTIKYESRIRGAIQKTKELCPPLYLSVVATEKRVCRPPSTTVGQLTTYIYNQLCVCIYIYIYCKINL